jgi:hypothetical protein
MFFEKGAFFKGGSGAVPGDFSRERGENSSFDNCSYFLVSLVATNYRSVRVKIDMRFEPLFRLAHNDPTPIARSGQTSEIGLEAGLRVVSVPRVMTLNRPSRGPGIVQKQMFPLLCPPQKASIFG